MQCVLNKKVLSIFFSTLLIFWFLSSQTIAASNHIQLTSGPTLAMNPNGVTPLAGVVELTTNVPVKITLEVDDGSATQTINFSNYATNHTLPVLGLKPNRSYNIWVIATDSLNKSLELDTPLQADTAPLPNDFPTINVLVSQPDKMEPGFTLIDRLGVEGSNQVSPYTIIFDNAGDVVWYSRTVGGSTVTQLTSGNLLWRIGDSIIIEADLLGNEIRQIAVQDTPNHTILLHHELYPTDHNTFLSLSRDIVEVAGYPTSYSDPDAPTQIADIEDNPVVEIGLDGQILHIWPLTDLLSPHRIGYASLRTSRGTGAIDWAHANAVYHVESDDSLLVSIRHQDAVIKFSRSTGNLIWILGPHANWPATYQKYLLQSEGSRFNWQYSQHAMMPTPAGNILMFDNHNFGASPFDERAPIADKDNCSRAVEYEVNEANMTIRQIWEYGADLSECLYSPTRGDADYLPLTGNVLVTFSAVRWVGGTLSADIGLGNEHTRIIEVDHNAPAERVFDLMLYNSDPAAKITVYRADRIPSLYHGFPKITFPNGGEELFVGKTHEITWSFEGDIENVKIEYSINGGSDWIEIVVHTENDGSYDWEVPNNPSDECLMKISDVDGDSFDESDAVFTITPPICKADFNDDGNVNYIDLETLSLAMGELDCTLWPALCDCDTDADNDVDGADLGALAVEFGRTDCP